MYNSHSCKMEFQAIRFVQNAHEKLTNIMQHLLALLRISVEWAAHMRASQFMCFRCRWPTKKWIFFNFLRHTFYDILFSAYFLCRRECFHSVEAVCCFFGPRFFLRLKFILIFTDMHGNANVQKKENQWLQKKKCTSSVFSVNFLLPRTFIGCNSHCSALPLPFFDRLSLSAQEGGREKESCTRLPLFFFLFASVQIHFSTFSQAHLYLYR